MFCGPFVPPSIIGGIIPQRGAKSNRGFEPRIYTDEHGLGKGRMKKGRPEDGNQIPGAAEGLNKVFNHGLRRLHGNFVSSRVRKKKPGISSRKESESTNRASLFRSAGLY
jgi:hypothetical protein